MEQYRKFVLDLAKGKVDRVFINSDEKHALPVLVNLVKSAKDTVRIFAGCLCEHIGNEQEYIEALSDFVEKDGKIHILLNNYNNNLVKQSNLFKRLAYYTSEGKDIQIKTTSVHPYLTNDINKKEVHFTIADKTGYRIETDIEKRTAECNFNNPVLAGSYADFFDKIFNDEASSCIDLITLFDYASK